MPSLALTNRCFFPTGKYCFKFSKYSSEKLRVHFVFEGDGIKRIRFPNNCHKMFSNENVDSPIHSIDFSGVDTSQVTSMINMFAGCNNIRELDLRPFNTKKVREYGLAGMFNECYSLKELNISTFTENQKSDIPEMFIWNEEIINKCHITKECEPAREEHSELQSAGCTTNSIRTDNTDQARDEDLKIEGENVLNDTGAQSHQASGEVRASQYVSEQPLANEKDLRITLLQNTPKKCEVHFVPEIPQKAPQVIKQKKEKKNKSKKTPTIDANSIIKGKRWYDPIVKFFRIIGRKISSWLYCKI